MTGFHGGFDLDSHLRLVTLDEKVMLPPTVSNNAGDGVAGNARPSDARQDKIKEK